MKIDIREFVIERFGQVEDQELETGTRGVRMFVLKDTGEIILAQFSPNYRRLGVRIDVQTTNSHRPLWEAQHYVFVDTGMPQDVVLILSTEQLKAELASLNKVENAMRVDKGSGTHYFSIKLGGRTQERRGAYDDDWSRGADSGQRAQSAAQPSSSVETSDDVVKNKCAQIQQWILNSNGDHSPVTFDGYISLRTAAELAAVNPSTLLRLQDEQIIKFRRVSKALWQVELNSFARHLVFCENAKAA